MTGIKQIEREKTIFLVEVVEADGQKYTQLTMRRPKVRDQKTAQKMAGSPEDIETILFANLCNVPAAVIDELDMADYVAMQETYKGFLHRPGVSSAGP
jgi:hypothetical protein